MKVDNFYVCFTKDGERRLLYKKYKKINGVYQIVFYDIENDVIIDDDFIDFNYLSSFENYISSSKNKKIITLKYVKALYKKDCELEFFGDSVAYYNLYKKDNLGKLELLKENILLAKYRNKFQEWYKDIMCNEVVSYRSLKYDLISSQIVEYNRSINFFKDWKISKKKLLELSYKKEL